MKEGNIMASATPDIGKLKRSYLLHYIDANFNSSAHLHGS